MVEQTSSYYKQISTILRKALIAKDHAGHPDAFKFLVAQIQVDFPQVVTLNT